MNVREEMRKALAEALEKAVQGSWESAADLVSPTFEALEEAGFVPDSAQYRACHDVVMRDEDGEWEHGVIGGTVFHDLREAHARATRSPFYNVPDGVTLVSEDRYVERRVKADWRRVK